MRLGKGDPSGECIGCLLTNSSSLTLFNIRGLNQTIETLVTRSVDCFSSLKSLSVANCDYTLPPVRGSGSQYDPLPNLEHLKLIKLTALESISEIAVHLGLRFSSLGVLHVLGCPKLKYLLNCSTDFTQTLGSLEEIRLHYCERLHDLFIYSPGQSPTSYSVAQNLRTIYLYKLPKLKTLCRGREPESWEHIEELGVTDCRM